MMINVYSLLNEKEENIILKRSAFWNMIASVLNALLSSILLFVITRVGDIDAAGIFSIASAIAYQCLSLGNFGSRTVQVSDVKKEYSFSDYCSIRIISSILMYGLLIYYSFFSCYSHDKALAILSFGLFKSIDAIEDIVHGEYHRQNRLDVSSFLLTVRYIIAIISFIVIYLVSRDLVLTSFISAGLTILIFLLQNRKLIKQFVNEKYKFNYIKVKSLLMILIPITFSNYVRMYAVNLPKYSIDANLSLDMQTYFNILMMPIFIITLLSDVIFRPFMVKFSVYWENKEIKEFNKLLFFQLLIVLLLTLVMIIGGSVIGLRLLEIVYGVQLKEYMTSLIILLIAGGFNTASSLCTILLTIQRKPKQIVIANTVITIIGICISSSLVITFGIFGASLLCLFICFMMFVTFLGLVLFTSMKAKKR